MSVSKGFQPWKREWRTGDGRENCPVIDDRRTTLCHLLRSADCEPTRVADLGAAASSHSPQNPCLPAHPTLDLLRLHSTCCHSTSCVARHTFQSPQAPSHHPYTHFLTPLFGDTGKTLIGWCLSDHYISNALGFA